MPTHTDQALCIRQWDWSETSQTVWMFARTLGMVRAVAKGSKRQKSRFSGGIEPLTRGEMVVIIKPGADLANMIAWDLQENFPPLRRSLSSFYAGMYLADLVQHSITERDPHPALFDALEASLRELGSTEGDQMAVLQFQWATMVETGYRPDLERDILTGEELQAAATYVFSPVMGGFTPDPLTPPPGAGHPQGPLWRVRGSTLDLLRLLAHGEPLRTEAADEWASAIDRANRLLAVYLREVMGRDLPTRALVFRDRHERPQ